MCRVVVVIVLLLISFGARTQDSDSMISAEGRFFAQEGDSDDFIKTQILYQALRNAITMELQKMDLDSESFWQTVDSRFEDNFKATQKQIEKKYGVGGPTQSKADREAYPVALRQTRLTQKAKYLSLQKLMKKWLASDSHPIKPESPKDLVMGLRVELDRPALGRLVSKMMGTGPASATPFDALYVSVEAEIVNAEWASIGVMNKEDLISVLRDHWIAQLKKQRPASIGDVLPAVADVQDRIHARMNMPEGDLKADDPLRKSLWMKIQVQIRKEDEVRSLKEVVLSMSAGPTLTDLATQHVLVSADLSKKTDVMRMLSPEKMLEQVANSIYRLPLTRFSKMLQGLSDRSSVMNTRVVVVENPSGMNAVLNVIEMLRERGAMLRLGAELSSYSKEKASILLRYAGTEDAVKQFLLSLKGSSTSNKVMVKWKNEAQLDVMELQP